MTRNTTQFLIILITLVTANYFYLGSYHHLQLALYNSDALYLPVLFSDIFNNNGNLSDWYLTPAPYFFPDFLIYYIAHTFSKNIFTQIEVFFTLQIIFTQASIYLLARQINATYALESSTLGIALIIFLAVTTGEPFIFVFSSAHHFGTLISLILTTALWLKINTTQIQKNRNILLLTASSISFLSSLSDNLFLVQAIAPFAITATIIFFIEKERTIKYMAMMALVVASGIIGSLSYRIFITNDTRFFSTNKGLSIEYFFHNLNEVGHTIYLLLSNNHTYTIIIAVSVILIALSLLKATNSNQRFLALMTLISIPATIISISFLVSPAPLRYFIPTLIIPIVISLILATNFLTKKFILGFNLIATTLVMILLLAKASTTVAKNSITLDYYPDEIRCFDEALGTNEFRRGIAHYWDAKRIQAFSKRNITIAQYLENLDQFKWITSNKFFSSEYSFVIVNESTPSPHRIRENDILKINGAPIKSVTCGDKKILIYR